MGLLIDERIIVKFFLDLCWNRIVLKIDFVSVVKSSNAVI